MTTVAAYIDGFNLYYGMKNKYGRKHMWLDVIELVRQLRPKDDVTRVRYFSAIVKNEPAAAQNQLDYIAALKTRNGALLEVHLGRFKDRTIRDCRRCGAPYTCRCGRIFKSFEEKGTDVALGAMMVADAALGVADTTLQPSAALWPSRSRKLLFDGPSCPPSWPIQQLDRTTPVPPNGPEGRQLERRRPASICAPSPAGPGCPTAAPAKSSSPPPAASPARPPAAGRARGR